MTLLDELRARYDVVAREAAKFGTVGAFAYAVDVGVYNALHVGLGVGPLTSKLVSSVVAATCAFVGNRQWSFRHRARTRAVHHEYALFILLNAVGLVLALLCLGFGYYVLDMRSALASNLWGNVIGTGFGTMFRFWSYRRFIWTRRDAVATAAEDGDVAAGVALDLAEREARQDGRSRGRTTA
ncbi:MAG TPA: GtrA family protein [Mycobacteriales bacterium]|nr:GtrA family protein [Mycobacteriales bacterium]